MADDASQYADVSQRFPHRPEPRGEQNGYWRIRRSHTKIVLQQIIVGLSLTRLAASIAADRYGIVTNVRHHMPSIRFKTLRRIIGKPAFNMTINGNAIVIVKQINLPKPSVLPTSMLHEKYLPCKRRQKQYCGLQYCIQAD